MAQTIVTVVQLAVAFLVLAVEVGRWGGKLESRPVSRRNETTGTNGTPSNGELARKIDALQAEFGADRRNYLSVTEATVRWDANRREHDELWGAVKGLREVDGAITRRVDGLMGSS